MDDDKFAKDVAANHDRADVKKALDRETDDGPGFEDESELGEFQDLPDAEELSTQDPMEELK